MATNYTRETTGETTVTKLYGLRHECLTTRKELKATIETRAREQTANAQIPAEQQDIPEADLQATQLQELQLRQLDAQIIPQAEGTIKEVAATIDQQLDEVRNLSSVDDERQKIQQARRTAWTFLEQTHSLRTTRELDGLTIAQPGREATHKPETSTELAEARKIMNDNVQTEWTIDQFWKRLQVVTSSQAETQQKLRYALNNLETTNKKLTKSNNDLETGKHEYQKALKERDNARSGKIQDTEKIKRLELEAKSHRQQLNEGKDAATARVNKGEGDVGTLTLRLELEMEEHAYALQIEKDKQAPLNELIATLKHDASDIEQDKSRLEEQIKSLREDASAAQRNLEQQIDRRDQLYNHLVLTTKVVHPIVTGVVNPNITDEQAVTMVESILRTTDSNTPKLVLQLPNDALAWDISTQDGARLPEQNAEAINTAPRTLWLLSCFAPTQTSKALDMIEISRENLCNKQARSPATELDRSFVVDALLNFQARFETDWDPDIVPPGTEQRALVIARCMELAIRLQCRIDPEPMQFAQQLLIETVGSFLSADESPILIGLIEWLRRALHQPDEADSLLNIIIAQPHLSYAPTQLGGAHERRLIGTPTSNVIVDFGRRNVSAYAHRDMGLESFGNLDRRVLVHPLRRINGDYRTTVEPFVFARDLAEQESWISDHLQHGFDVAYERMKAKILALDPDVEYPLRQHAKDSMIAR